jgi:prolyl-tRNA editing enzyme YbaK/EbsC (Cys-tRNA(Pro) deacylase)
LGLRALGIDAAISICKHVTNKNHQEDEGCYFYDAGGDDDGDGGDANVRGDKLKTTAQRQQQLGGKTVLVKSIVLLLEETRTEWQEGTERVPMKARETEREGYQWVEEGSFVREENTEERDQLSADGLPVDRWQCQLVCAVLRASRRLHLPSIAAAVRPAEYGGYRDQHNDDHRQNQGQKRTYNYCSSFRLKLAPVEELVSLCGYPRGCIGPIGLRSPLQAPVQAWRNSARHAPCMSPTSNSVLVLLDDELEAAAAMLCGAGRPQLVYGVAPAVLLSALRGGQGGDGEGGFAPVGGVRAAPIS